MLYSGQLTPVAKVAADGTIVEQYVYGTGINSPDYIVKGDRKYRLVKDHLGSVRLVVDTHDGAVVKRLDYDVSGMVIGESGDFDLLFGFAGGFRDADTGLTKFGARWYDPETGRWTSKEPLGFNGSSNFYVYAGNDPVNWVDVTGRLAAPVHFLATFFAARSEGRSIGESWSLAWGSVKVDFGESSQGIAAANTALHAMSGLKDAINYQTEDEALKANQIFIDEEMRLGNICESIHAAQDRATPLHAGKEWHGFDWNLDTAKHLAGDILPFFAPYTNAYVNTVQVLRQSEEIYSSEYMP